jgi:UDP-N-acetylglucosamine:LPS N-acetylglucosamine transferase
MEQDLVPKSGIAMDSINFTGMRGKGLKHTVSGAFKMVKAFADCFSFIGRRKPDVVMGMGGYVTVPGGLMARLRGTPLVLVNADAALLLSNKTLVPAASACASASRRTSAMPPARLSSPAIRCARRSWTWRAGAALCRPRARCASWWWAAAWAQGAQRCCLRRWR